MNPRSTRAKLLDGQVTSPLEQSDDEAVGLLEASLSCAKAAGATSTARLRCCTPRRVRPRRPETVDPMSRRRSLSFSRGGPPRSPGRGRLRARGRALVGAHDLLGHGADRGGELRRRPRRHVGHRPVAVQPRKTVRSVFTGDAPGRAAASYSEAAPRSQAQSATSGTSASHTEGSHSRGSHTANGAGKTRRRTPRREPLLPPAKEIGVKQGS